MNRWNGLAVIALAMMLLEGCSSTLQATKLDETGHFSTGTLVDSDGVKAEKAFSEKYKAMLYVKIDDSKTEKYKSFFVSSFENMGTFSKVDQKSDLEQLVIEKKLSASVPNVSDMIGLHNLEGQIGPFIVVEPYVEWKGGYNFVASLKATDPETGETVLWLEQKAFNWAGLDKPLFYPLLNGFLEWTQGKKISQAQPGPN
jgi:hypothetical protein